MSNLLLGAMIGFTAGFSSAMLAAWWGFRRGIEVNHPELLQKPKPIGKVEFTDIDPIAR
jgi:hypothetical protein